MFCLKCGSHLPDDAKFCGVCGAPVNTVQENAPVMQQPAGTANEAENTQMPNAASFMEAPQFNGQIGCGVAALVQKKSKKGLIIGLSIGGGVLLAAVVAVILFASGLFNPASSDPFSSVLSDSSSPALSNSVSPFPVLDTGIAQIYYGENVDLLEEAFPNMEKHTESIYSLERSEDQRVDCFVREDKETGEKKLVRWRTNMEHTGLTNGIFIGDSYEKILSEYPDAICSTEWADGPPRKYDPKTDTDVFFSVYMDEKGNTYSHAEFKRKLDIIRENGTEEELTKWYVLDFTVQNGRIIDIYFSDYQAMAQGR